MATLSIEEFRTLCGLFSDKVAKGYYHKFDYPTWRILSRLTNSPITLNLIGESIEFDSDLITFKLDCNDNSFGTFLSKNVNFLMDVITYDNSLSRAAISKAHATFTDNKEKSILLPSVRLEPNTAGTCITDRINDLDAKVSAINDTIMSNSASAGERKTMKFNFDFGPVSENVRMSPYGMAIKNREGVFVAYDKANSTVIDVDVFNFNGARFLYKMPVALKDVAISDVVIHNRVPMFVTRVEGNELEAVDIFNGERKNILPTTNMFGFNFVTKVVSFIDMGTPNPDNPFGNLLPLFLLGNENAEAGGNKDLLFAMMMCNGGNATFSANPMMGCLMAMSMSEAEEEKSSNFLPMLMAMNMSQGMNALNAAPAPSATAETK